MGDQIDDLEAIIVEEIDTLTQREVATMVKRIQQKLKDANKRFFQVLASKIVDAPGPPQLEDAPPHEPEWFPLTPKYLRWKQRRGFSTNFYVTQSRRQGRTQLGRSLRAMDGTAILGTPTVTVTGGTSEGEKGVYMYVDTRGNYRAKDERGRFRKVTDIYRRIPREMSFDAFPNLEDLNLDSIDGSVEEAVFGHDNDVIYKMAFRGNNQYQRGGSFVLRPFTGFFMQWWAQSQVRKIIEGAI